MVGRAQLHSTGAGRTRHALRARSTALATRPGRQRGQFSCPCRGIAAFEERVNPQNEAKLRRKIAAASSAAIAKNGYVTAIDALLATGWLRPEKVEEWRRG